MTDFAEPTRASLSALAGWALTKRNDTGSPAQHALRKFGDGCDLMVEVIDDIRSPTKPARGGPSLPAPRRESDERIVPLAVIEATGQRDCRNGGNHNFSIETQICKGCGRTYLEVMGVEPELF